MNKYITRWFVIFLLSWFILLSSVSNATPALAVPIARAIITHPEVKKRAIQLLLTLGGSYALHLKHKDGSTNINDMNCGINGTVSKGSSIQQVEQIFKEQYKYVNLWYSGRNGKYNVYGINYGESEKYAYLVSVWCGGPNELDDDNIIIDAEPAAQDILEQAKLGNVQAQDFIKFAIKAENPSTSDDEIDELIKSGGNKPIPTPTNPPLNPPAIPPQPISPPSADPTTAPPQPIAGNPTQPITGKKSQAQCDAEWDEAYKICRELIKKGIKNGITGGYTNDFQCAKGLVSEECGGNKVK